MGTQTAIQRLAICAMLLAYDVAGNPCARADELDERAAAAAHRYGQQLAALADWSDQQGLEEQARLTRQWQRPVTPFQLTVDRLPVQAGSLLAAVNLSREQAEWQSRFGELRRTRAEELFGFAREAIGRKRISLAFDLVGEVLRENPDHPTARRILGYQLNDDEWLTPFALSKKRAGQVWHDRFGWIPERLVERYEAGERYYKGRMISPDEDQQIHASIDTGWEVETEHFHVTTNHSLEVGARIGALLEDVAEVWERLMPGYVWSDVELKKMFDGGPRPARARRQHDVLVFRDETQYKQALRGEIPEQVRTTGIYIGRRRTAYFFVDASDSGAAAPDDSTMVHEAVHQLFNERRRVAPNIGATQNFWIVEGIACYFESLVAGERERTVGGTSALRLQNARQRLFQEEFYLPLAALSALGTNELQRDPQIAKLYSQSAGLTHFLMHGEEGRFRDALVTFLSAVYSGRDRVSTLTQLTGQDFPELDERYRRFLEQTALSTP